MASLHVHCKFDEHAPGWYGASINNFCLKASQYLSHLCLSLARTVHAVVRCRDQYGIPISLIWRVKKMVFPPVIIKKLTNMPMKTSFKKRFMRAKRMGQRADGGDYHTLCQSNWTWLSSFSLQTNATRTSPIQKNTHSGCRATSPTTESPSKCILPTSRPIPALALSTTIIWGRCSMRAKAPSASTTAPFSNTSEVPKKQLAADASGMSKNKYETPRSMDLSAVFLAGVERAAMCAR